TGGDKLGSLPFPLQPLGQAGFRAQDVFGLLPGEGGAGVPHRPGIDHAGRDALGPQPAQPVDPERMGQGPGPVDAGEPADDPQGRVHGGCGGRRGPRTSRQARGWGISPAWTWGPSWGTPPAVTGPAGGWGVAPGG